MQCVSFAPMIRLSFLGCLAPLLLLSSIAGGPHPAAEEVQNPEPYLSDPNSVGFDITPLPGKDSTRRWEATYSDHGETARFEIEIGFSRPMEQDAGDAIKMSAGQGAILAMPGSDASTMLIALQKALEAKHCPKKVQRASRLTFDYVILADHNSQASDGGVSPKPAGNWTAMKIFLGNGDDEGEVFLNFNPVSGKAQFSEKDIDYGDSVLAKLATVL